MRSMGAADAKNRFGELLATAQREPVTIEKHGRPVAVVVSAEDYRRIEALEFARLRCEIQKGLKDIELGRVVDGRAALDALRKRVT